MSQLPCNPSIRSIAAYVSYASPTLPPEIAVDELDDLILRQSPLDTLNFFANVPAIEADQRGQSTH